MYKINIGIFIILAIVFLSALFIGGTFFYGIFYFILFLFLSAYYSGEKIYNSMECVIWKASEKVNSGSNLSYFVEIYNSSPFIMPYAQISLLLSKRLTGIEEKSSVRAIIPGQKTKIERKFICLHKGVYDIGNVEVEFSDPFLIFKWKKSFKGNVFLTVYPRVYDISNIKIPARQHFGTISVKDSAYEDFTSVKDIRKYIDGDSFKKIHWKVSAHRGEFYVKNLDLNASTHIHIFWDLYKEHYTGEKAEDVEEKGAECSVSLIKYCLSKGIGVNFCAYGKEYINFSHKEAENFQTYLELITKLSTKGNIPVWELIKKEVQKLNNGVTIAVITPMLDRKLLDMVTALKPKGFEFIIFYIDDNENDEKSKKEILLNDIYTLRVGVDDDLEKVVRECYGKGAC